MKFDSENARQKAMRVLPVLVYYAEVRRTLTYGELGEITGDHHHSFRAAFGRLHEWIEDFAQERGEDALPLAIIVTQKGKPTPGAGAIRWRLKANGLSSNVAQPVIEALFKEEHHKIFDYSGWDALLQAHKLARYVPKKKPIGEITQELLRRQGRGAGESPAHERLKRFLSNNPQKAGLEPDCRLEGIEFVFPSLDRVDLMFQRSRTLYAVEVKSEEADEIELVRGLYQVVKYLALSRALQIDRNCQPLAHACLATSAILTKELRERARLLMITVIEGIVVPNNFRG